MEEEERYRLTDDEVNLLHQYPHALDYQFNEDQIIFLENNGYLLLSGFFEEELVDKLLEQIFNRAHELTGLIRDDMNTWEASGLFKRNYMDLWHLPAYYEMRQDPRLYSVFAQILRDPKLTVSLDRVSMKIPAWIEIEENNQLKKVDFLKYQRALEIHTDNNPWHLNFPQYQGSVCLENCPIGNGGFTVMPGYHKLDKIRKYRENYERGMYHEQVDGKRQTQTPPAREDIFLHYLDEEAIERDLIEVPMKKGDFLIWSTRLPHGNSLNTSNRWRLQCFINFIPESDRLYKIYREEVSRCVQSGTKPNMFSTGNILTQRNFHWEMPYHNRIVITPLGRKLFGLESWSN
jgi:hypothetical protein